MQQHAMQAFKLNVKSFNIVRAITDKNLFDKVKLTSTARLVLFNLANMYNLKKGCSFPKIKKLCKCTGCSDRSIEKALNELRINLLIVSSKEETKTNYYFTKNFYNLLEISSEQGETSSEETEKTSGTCHEQNNKQNIKQKSNFSFKNLNDLFKNNPATYSDEINELSDQDKEKLAKLKLGRTNLTEFQRQNINKLIMLSECEIKAVNKKEPYYRQENIDIYYSRRVTSIRKFQEKLEKSRIKKQKESPLNMTKEQAIEFLDKLPANLQNTYFAKELRKKYNL